MAGNENNPYADGNAAQKKTKVGDADHIVTRQDLEDANRDGAPNPATQAAKSSDADIMSGQRDHAGIPMNRAQAAATNANDAVQGKQGEKLFDNVHVDKDGNAVRVPPNTPAV